MTRQAVTSYSVGLLGLILVKVLAPGFYARQNIVTPVRIAVLTLVATQVLNAALIIPLAHAGLALAISLGACLNAGLLYRGLRRRGIYRPRPGWGPFFLKVGCAVVVMAVATSMLAGPDAWWLSSGPLPRAGALAGLVAAGAAIYFACLWLLGIRVQAFAGRKA